MRDRSSPASTSLWRTGWIPTRRSLRFCSPDRTVAGAVLVTVRSASGVGRTIMVSTGGCWCRCPDRRRPRRWGAPRRRCGRGQRGTLAARSCGSRVMDPPAAGDPIGQVPAAPRCCPWEHRGAATGRDVVRGARGRGRCRTAVGHGDPVGERLADLDPVAGAAAVQGLLWLELPAAGAKEYKWRLVADGRRVVCDRTARRGSPMRRDDQALAGDYRPRK